MRRSCVGGTLLPDFLVGCGGTLLPCSLAFCGGILLPDFLAGFRTADAPTTVAAFSRHQKSHSSVLSCSSHALD